MTAGTELAASGRVVVLTGWETTREDPVGSNRLWGAARGFTREPTFIVGTATWLTKVVGVVTGKVVEAARVTPAVD